MSVELCTINSFIAFLSSRIGIDEGKALTLIICFRRELRSLHFYYRLLLLQPPSVHLSLACLADPWKYNGRKKERDARGRHTCLSHATRSLPALMTYFQAHATQASLSLPPFTQASLHHSVPHRFHSSVRLSLPRCK